MTLHYMKKLLIAIATLAATSSFAQEYRHINNAWTSVYTNVIFSSNVTANVNFTNTIATALTIRFGVCGLRMKSGIISGVTLRLMLHRRLNT